MSNLKVGRAKSKGPTANRHCQKLNLSTPQLFNSSTLLIHVPISIIHHLKNYFTISLPHYLTSLSICFWLLAYIPIFQQNELVFFEKLIDKGFLELSNEWINEQINQSSDTKYKNQLKILLDAIKYKKLYTYPHNTQLKEFLSFFNDAYNVEVSKILDSKKGLEEADDTKLESFLLKLLDFLNYYDLYLLNINKNNLKLQDELNILVLRVFSAIEKIVKQNDLEYETKQKFEFYTLVLKFLHFKFTYTENDPLINSKISSLGKEFDNYYLETQPSLSAYEASLLKCKLYKMKLEHKIAKNDNKGINTILKEINSAVEEIYNKKGNIENNKTQIEPLTALIIRTAIFKLDMAVLLLKNNLVSDRDALYKESISDVNFIGSFPYQSLKLDALFRKAQIFEYMGNIKDALPLYLAIAKSSSSLSTTAQEILRKYQYNTTLSSDTEIFNELGKLINSNNAEKIWDFYTLYIKKRIFFTEKYTRTLQEMLTAFFATNNKYLENSIMNHYLFTTLPNDEQNSKQREIKLNNAILSLQDYVNKYKEEKGFFGELLNSIKTEFANNFPKSDLTQAILLKDVKAKIQEKIFDDALALIKQTKWTNVYEKEANILKKYLEIKIVNQVTKKNLLEFIKVIKINAKNNLYLISLSTSLFTHISFEKKQFKLAYRFLKNFLPALSENKDVYIPALEDAVKSSYYSKKYKDFERWVQEYLQINTPTDFIIELLKNYAIISAIKYNRNKAIKFFNLAAFAMKKNIKYNFADNLSEKIIIVNAIYKAFEYSINLKENISYTIAEQICNDLEKENDKTMGKYLLDQKIMSKEIAEDKFEKAKFVEAYKLLLQSQCLALKYRYTHDKNILEEIQKLPNKNKNSMVYKWLARDTILCQFIALKKNLYTKKELEIIYKNYSKLLTDMFEKKYVTLSKDKTDKFSKEFILLSLYQSIYTGQQMDKVKEITNKYEPQLNLKDTRKLFKIIYSNK